VKPLTSNQHHATSTNQPAPINQLQATSTKQPVTSNEQKLYAMDFRSPSTALFVKNINVSKKFWCELLKMPVKLDFGKNVILENGITLWEISKSHIIPQNLGFENIASQDSNRFEIYFETEDLTEDFNTLKNGNVIFLHEIHEEPWGQKTIRFFDPDNHLIEIGESMVQFISRLYNQGMSPEEVSGKTSVPVAEVRRLLAG
jgi:catechol 2,3-dioxygenase-like lactoylglutathione lyase family enzyme